MRNEEERSWVGNLIRKVRLAEDGFVFTRKEYERALERRAVTGHFGTLETEPPKADSHDEPSQGAESLDGEMTQKEQNKEQVSQPADETQT
jgi:hypothetical protein